MGNAIITGVGSSLPEKVLTNADLEKIVETSDEWIRTRTGIRERRVLSKGERLSEHGVRAGLGAVKDAGLAPDQIDLIINATFTGDWVLPSAACIIQEKMGITRPVPAFDLAAACSGWVYGLETASNFIKTGRYRHILVIGSDALTPITNWEDRGTCVLFGDGAGAAVVSHTDEADAGIIDADLGAVGKHVNLLYCEGGHSAMPAERLLQDPSLKHKYYIYMAGNELFKIVTRLVIDSVNRLLEKTGLSVSDVDLMIPHQANIRIIEYVASKLKFPMEKMGLTLEKYGNCSGGTVPVTLHDCLKSGRIKKGDNVIFTAFGGGLTYASVLVKWA
jgi:3-oxoacyl-[acyl-carrier-protein] synthase-3